MSETPLHADARGATPPGRGDPNPAMLILKALASLRITVVLFALSILLVFYGTLEGYLKAVDAKTGKELWRLHTIPKPGEPGSDTWGSSLEMSSVRSAS